MFTMASIIFLCSILLVTVLQSVISIPQGRIIDGNLVDTLRRFPHHVAITNNSNGTRPDCSGSIINDRWMLTSMHCVSAEKFTVQFRMRTLNVAEDSFAITLGKSSVVPYPTGYDNIALVKLPVSLYFTEDLSYIPYTRQPGEAYKINHNGFVVMPGFSPYTDELTYGMFRLISPTDCKAKYGKAYDEYLQICTLGWSNNNQVPCEGNEGGGLVIGWPRQPRLIGVFTSSVNCVKNMPAMYVNLAQYEKWIEEVISEDSEHYSDHYYWK